MSDLPETLQQTCSIVAELENERAHGAKALRARVDLVATASSMLAFEPEPDFETVALAELVRELRDEAALLRQRHRVVKHMVLSMID